MRDDGGADDAARFDGDLQSAVPLQAEADVVGEVFVTVARVKHYYRTKREQLQMKTAALSGPDLPAIACKRFIQATVRRLRRIARPERFSASQ